MGGDGVGTEAPDARAATRARLVDVAAHLLHEGGPAAVTTRAVAAAAGVQAPTIYRLFGDKDGLLEAVAEHVATTYVTAKGRLAQAAAVTGVDPLQDLRTAWDAQVDFCLTHPAVFQLLSDPQRVRRSAAAQAGRRVLAARVHRLALAGLLRVAEDRCVDLIQSAAIGVIQTLLSTPHAQRDAALPGAMWDAVLTHVLATTHATSTGGADDGTDATRTGDGSAATLVAFRALAPRLHGLSSAERRLLVEWLHRSPDPHAAPPPP